MDHHSILCMAHFMSTDSQLHNKLTSKMSVEATKLCDLLLPSPPPAYPPPSSPSDLSLLVFLL